jgi:hypothetical protein
MGFYSVIKMKEILLFVGKWMELGRVILSEVGQVQIAKGCKYSLSSVEYKPNTNTSNIMENRRSLTGEGG